MGKHRRRRPQTIEELGLDPLRVIDQGAAAARSPAAPSSAAAIAGRAQRKNDRGLNRTEQAFEWWLGEFVGSSIARVDFEPEGLRIATKGDACVFWPDFRIVWADGLIDFVDVKGTGPVQDDSLVKIKTASVLHPMYTFRMAKRQRRCDGGGWVVRTFARRASWEDRIAELSG